MSKKKQRPKQTAHQEQPQWQPISMLQTLGTHIDGMLESDVEQYETLQLARTKPYVLDDFTVKRVKQVFSDQRKDFGLFDEQLQRWQTGPLTDDQRQEVLRLVEQMKALRQNNTQVLALADELGRSTIEKQLAKSDAQLGLEYLMKMMRET